MEKKTIEVVAALILRGDRFLACQRPPEKARGLLWEFVGGKVESGESGPEALVRECQEELDVTLKVGAAVMDVTHEYPDLTVHLTLYEAEIAEGEPRMIEHHDMRWVTAEEMDQLEFCPADQVFLDEIRRRLARKDQEYFVQ